MLRTSDPAEDGRTSRDGSVRARWSDHSHDRAQKAVSLLTRTGVFATALLVVTGGASAQHGSGGMMGGGGYGTFGIPGLGFVFPVLLVLGTVALLAYAREGFRPDASGETDVGRGRSDRALDTLRERYARGELEDEEFERRRAELERSR